MSQSFVQSNDIDHFLSELQNTRSRDSFDSAMRRFEDSYLHQYKSSNPAPKGKFPFGTTEIPNPVLPVNLLCTPYSHLGSFYQPEPSRPQPIPVQFKRYEEIYNVPMYERAARHSIPAQTRTEFVPYPYPHHPQYEYSQSQKQLISIGRKNPLQESMDLRRVKEEMFNLSLHGDHMRSATPTYHEENKEPFRSFYSRK